MQNMKTFLLIVENVSDDLSAPSTKAARKMVARNCLHTSHVYEQKKKENRNETQTTKTIEGAIINIGTKNFFGCFDNDSSK